MTIPARLASSGSAETITAGRLPDCSRPTGPPNPDQPDLTPSRSHDDSWRTQ
jgi:hypothetical protein